MSKIWLTGWIQPVSQPMVLPVALGRVLHSVCVGPSLLLAVCSIHGKLVSKQDQSRVCDGSSIEGWSVGLILVSLIPLQQRISYQC